MATAWQLSTGQEEQADTRAAKAPEASSLSATLHWYSDLNPLNLIWIKSPKSDLT